MTAEPIRPVAQSERIDILDILRGFAIFGILAVNISGFAAPAFMPGYAFPASAPWYDTLAKNGMLFFTEGKFYTIFSFLFGLGFSVQLARSEARGKDIRSFYPRRLWVLFGFGILHALLLWTGDILRLYALLGFALLAFRQRSNRTLLTWAGIFFGLSLLILGLIGGPHGGEESIPGVDLLALARAAYTSPNPLDVITFQAVMLPISFLFILLAQGASVMALFLLGLVAGRLKFFENLSPNRAILKRVAAWGLLIGLVGNSLFVLFEDAWLPSLGITLGAPAFACVYVSGLALFSLSERGKRWLRPIANVGRMALSNYVLQSLVCSLLFNGYGLGLYEHAGAAAQWGLTLGIYLLQIPLSTWWLARFRFGPLEWIWRSLTYGQRQPFVLRAAQE